LTFIFFYHVMNIINHNDSYEEEEDGGT